MTEYLNNGKGQEMPLSEVHLGDTVEIFDGPYGTGIVNKIDDQVHFFRPYAHGENWSYTGGIICYTGIETFSRLRSKTETIKFGDAK